MSRLINPDELVTPTLTNEEVKTKMMEELLTNQNYEWFDTYDNDALNTTLDYIQTHSYRYLEDAQRSSIQFYSKYFPYQVAPDNIDPKDIREGVWFLDRRDECPCFIIGEDIIDPDNTMKYYRSEFYHKILTLNDISNHPEIFDRFPIIMMGNTLLEDISIELTTNGMLIKVDSINYDNYKISGDGKYTRDLFIMVVSNTFYKQVDMLAINAVPSPTTLYNESTHQLCFTPTMLGIDKFRNDGTYFLAIKTDTRNDFYIHDCYQFTKSNVTYLTPHINPDIIEEYIVPKNTNIRFSFIFIKDMYAYRGFDSKYAKFYNNSDKLAISQFTDTTNRQAELCYVLIDKGYTQDGSDGTTIKYKCPYIHLNGREDNLNSRITELRDRKLSNELDMPIPLEHIVVFSNHDNITNPNSNTIGGDKLLRYCDNTTPAQYVLNTFQMFDGIEFKENTLFKFFFLYSDRDRGTKVRYSQDWLIDSLCNIFKDLSRFNIIQDLFNGLFYRGNELNSLLVLNNTIDVSNAEIAHNLVQYMKSTLSILHAIYEPDNSGYDNNIISLLKKTHDNNDILNGMKHKRKTLENYIKSDINNTTIYSNNRRNKVLSFSLALDGVNLTRRKRTTTGNETLPSFDYRLKEESYVFVWDYGYKINRITDSDIIVRLDGLVINSNIEMYYNNQFVYIYIPVSLMNGSKVLELDILRSLYMNGRITFDDINHVYKLRIPEDGDITLNDIVIKDSDGTPYKSAIQAPLIIGSEHDSTNDNISDNTAYNKIYDTEINVVDKSKLETYVGTIKDVAKAYSTIGNSSYWRRLVISDPDNQLYDPQTITSISVNDKSPVNYRFTRDIQFSPKSASSTNKTFEFSINKSVYNEVIVPSDDIDQHVPIIDNSIVEESLADTQYTDTKIYVGGKYIPNTITADLYSDVKFPLINPVDNTKIEDKKYRLLNFGTYKTSVFYELPNYKLVPIPELKFNTLTPTATSGNSSYIIMTLPKKYIKLGYQSFNTDNYEFYVNGRRLTKANVFQIDYNHVKLVGLKSLKNVQVYRRLIDPEVFLIGADVDNSQIQGADVIKSIDNMSENSNIDSDNSTNQKLNIISNNYNKLEFINSAIIRNLINTNETEYIRYINDANTDTETDFNLMFKYVSTDIIKNTLPNGDKEDSRISVYRFYIEELYRPKILDANKTQFESQYLNGIYPFVSDELLKKDNNLTNGDLYSTISDSYDGNVVLVDSDIHINSANNIFTIGKLIDYNKVKGWY